MPTNDTLQQLLPTIPGAAARALAADDGCECGTGCDCSTCSCGCGG